MLRTSLYLPATLHQRLQVASRQSKKSISRLVQDLLDKALREDEEKRLDQMYEALRKMDGMIKDPVTDASTTIDEVLYGEDGAWRGEPGDNALWELPTAKKP